MAYLRLRTRTREEVNHDQSRFQLPHSRLLSTAEVAEILGLRPNTLEVWRCTRRNHLPYVKIGSRVAYQLSDVLEFIAANRHDSKSKEVD